MGRDCVEVVRVVREEHRRKGLLTKKSELEKRKRGNETTSSAVMLFSLLSDLQQDGHVNGGHILWPGVLVDYFDLVFLDVTSI